LSFPSVKCYKQQQVLDYHRFHIVLPKLISTISHPSIIVNNATGEPPLISLLVHQCLGDHSDKVSDTMCQKQTLLGLPKTPFSSCTYPCAISTTQNLPTLPKPKFHLINQPNVDNYCNLFFSFWNVTSIPGFDFLLSIIDGKDRLLWNFPTACKHTPVSILDKFSYMLTKEYITVHCAHIDEDGALANHSESCDFWINRTLYP